MTEKSSRSISTGRRFRFIDVPYTEEQRAALKQERIREAVEWEPPITHAEVEEIPKDDPEYETALLRETITWMNLGEI